MRSIHLGIAIRIELNEWMHTSLSIRFADRFLFGFVDLVMHQTEYLEFEILTIPLNKTSNKKLLQEEDFSILCSFIPLELKSSSAFGSSSRYVESRFVDSKLRIEKSIWLCMWNDMTNRTTAVIPRPFWWCWCCFAFFIRCSPHLNVHFVSTRWKCWQFRWRCSRIYAWINLQEKMA